MLFRHRSVDHDQPRQKPRRGIGAGHPRARRRLAHERTAAALEDSARKHEGIAAHLRDTGQGGLAAGYERLAERERADAQQHLRQAGRD